MSLFKGTSRFAAIFTLMLFVACGGGGGGGGGGSTTPAPSGLQYPTPPAFAINQAVSPLSPTVTGQVTSYAVSPALPAGLAISATTGVISGTPTAVTLTATYTVTAANSTGNTTVNISITVNDIAPAISYLSPYYAFTANFAAQTISPSLTGGAVTGWSISPALPAGLTFDIASGNIAGTPTAASAAAAYVVTATNSGGNATANLTIAIASGPLLDLGHAADVLVVRSNGTDVVSLDAAGHWILQNYSSGVTLASGDGACGPAGASGINCSFATTNYPPVYTPVDVAGSVMIDLAASGLEVRSASDGHVLATLPGQFLWYRLASDGSYICGGSATSLTAWTTTGQTLFTHSGDYSYSNVFAAPGTVFVAQGPAGASLIESISVATGTATQSPTFQGQFVSWFLDGNSFVTTLGDAVWTYSSSGVQKDLTQDANGAGNSAGGTGNWLWIPRAGAVDIFQVGSSTTPAFSQPTGAPGDLPIPSGNLLSLGGAGESWTIIDLSGNAPVATSYTLPIPYITAFAAIPGGAWIVANSHGVLLDGATIAATQPRYLTPGVAWSIAGGTDYFSIATASGVIYSYNSVTNAPVGTINFSSSALSASVSGAILAAGSNGLDAQFSPTPTVNVYSVPSGNIQNTFAATANAFDTSNTNNTVVLSLSASGNALAAPISNTSGCLVEVVDLAGGAPVWCRTGAGAGVFGNVQLSPDGTLIADTRFTDTTSFAITNIFQNGTLLTAIPGPGVAWLDNGRLFANTFEYEASKFGFVYVNSQIYDPNGNVLSTVTLPQEVDALDVATSSTIYAPKLNQMYSVTTGLTTWASGDAVGSNYFVGSFAGSLGGAVAGSQVIFSSGSLILAQPY